MKAKTAATNGRGIQRIGMIGRTDDLGIDSRTYPHEVDDSHPIHKPCVASGANYCVVWHREDFPV